MSRVPTGGQLAGRDRLLGDVQQILECLVGDGVDVLVGRAELDSRLDQMLVTPTGALDNRKLQRPQSGIELGLGVGLRLLHWLGVYNLRIAVLAPTPMP